MAAGTRRPPLRPAMTCSSPPRPCLERMTGHAEPVGINRDAERCSLARRLYRCVQRLKNSKTLSSGFQANVMRILSAFVS